MLEFLLRPAQSIEEAQKAQELDNRIWNNGYQHYEWLYKENPNLLLVSIERRIDKFIGYVGVEKFYKSDLEVGHRSNYTKSMPPWNHNPEEWHKGDGSVYHITGAAVIPEAWKEGVFEKLMQFLIERARQDNEIKMVASTYNLRHPTVRNPLKVWGKLGMSPLPQTYDPNWNHDGEKHLKGTPDDGSIIWAIGT